MERQQVITELASCSTWLQHAESLLLELRPVGRDLVDVGRQFRAMQGFWVEFEEQRDKICHVLVVGAQMLDGQTEADEERSIVELVKMQHARLGENWGRVQEEAIQAKKTLDKTYPALVHFQSLCTQVGESIALTAGVTSMWLWMGCVHGRVLSKVWFCVSLWKQMRLANQIRLSALVTGNLIGKIV